MKYVLALALLLASNVPALAEWEMSQQERAHWAVYYDCAEPHLLDIARHVSSLEEGADLIAGSLCTEEFTALLNKVAGRTMLDEMTVSERFKQADHVIKRDTRLWIYQTRRDG